MSEHPDMPNNVEYNAALYLVAMPEIFGEIKPLLYKGTDKTNPMSWYFTYFAEDAEKELPEDVTGFSHSEKMIVEAAASFWNGRNKVDMGGIVHRLDRRQFECLLEAMRLHRGDRNEN